MIDFIYGTIPTFTIGDFDNDGENELLVEYYIYHGTGFVQQSVAILDNTANWDGTKKWRLYNLTPETYVEALVTDFIVEDLGTELKVKANGKETIVSKEGDDSFMELYLDFRVRESHEDEDIIIETIPVLFSENNPLGLELETCYIRMQFNPEGYWSKSL